MPRRELSVFIKRRDRPAEHYDGYVLDMLDRPADAVGIRALVEVVPNDWGFSRIKAQAERGDVVR
jgi:hypothetical protein